MSKINDGGPAFPVDEKNDDGTHYNSHPGMTLRDWFAGQMLNGIASASNANEPLDIDIAADQFDVDCALREHWSICARTAYISADAMLVARDLDLAPSDIATGEI